MKKMCLQRQLEALLDGGVDLILFETIIDTLNAKAALFAAAQSLREIFRRLSWYQGPLLMLLDEPFQVKLQKPF